MAGINPKTGKFDFNYTAPQTNFGFGAPQSTPQSFGNFGAGQFMQPQAGSLNLSNTNFDPSQSINNFGFQAQQPSIDPNNTLGFNDMSGGVNPSLGGIAPPNTGMSGGDMLNFGSGVLQTGIGAYFANEQLGQGQQALDLSQQKYDEYLADKRKLDDVGASRAANANASSITFGG